MAGASEWSDGRGRPRGRWLGLGILTMLLFGAVTSTASAAGARFPTLSGSELRQLFYAVRPLPGTAVVTSRPSIYGDAAADRHIQALAEARGYRLQSTPTVGLGSYGGIT